MTKTDKLKKDLHSEFKKLILNLPSKADIGSITFWYDEYSASLEISKWTPNEVPWGIEGNNNIFLEDFDVFEKSEEFCSVVESFFDELQKSADFSKLPLRNGFNFVISGFDDGPTAVGDPYENGIANPFDYTLQDSIVIVASYFEKCLCKLKPSPLRQISIYGGSNASNFSFQTELSANRQDDNYFQSYEDWEVGLALTKIFSGTQSDFENLSTQITSSKLFNDFPKKDLVVICFIIKKGESINLVYDCSIGKVRLLNLKTEFYLLY